MHSMIELTAPASGRVSRVLVGPGTMVNQNRVIMTLDAAGALKLIGITRGPLAHLSPGVKARVWTTTLPGIVAHGAVLRATVMESADSSETAVEIQIDNPPIVFQPGIPARAVVELTGGRSGTSDSARCSRQHGSAALCVQNLRRGNGSTAGDARFRVAEPRDRSRRTSGRGAGCPRFFKISEGSRERQ